MADNNRNDNETLNDVDAQNGTEPATGHDVGIGGGIGAVGGAVVGGLAGGPIGAIIGAVVGGIASAGAVDVVDKHDHDYARTTGQADTAEEDEDETRGEYAGTTDTAPGRATEYTGPGDYARTRIDRPEAETAPAVDGYAGASAAPQSDFSDTSERTPATGADQTVQLHEERLSAQKEQVQTGEVTMHKEVITETKTIDVPVTREEVVIERHPVSGDQASGTGVSFGQDADQTIRVPVMEERVTLEKTPVVIEEVSLGKRTTTETQHVSDTVRHEELQVENPQNIPIQGAAQTGTGDHARTDMDDRATDEMDEDDLDSDVNATPRRTDAPLR